MSIASPTEAWNETRRPAPPAEADDGGPRDCLVAKFRRHKELTPAEIAFLEDLQTAETSLGPGQDLIQQGQPSEHLYVLKSGWAYGYKLLANGRRQVLEILLPGDLAGSREFAFGGALNAVATATHAVVCPFPRARLDEFYHDYPGLTAALVDMLLREQALLVERIADIGSRSAYQRVAHLFMEIYVRLCTVDPGSRASFEFPLSQTLIGEALGLSRVHVSRTVKELKRDGLLELRGRRATVLDEKRLIAAAEFDEFYLARL